MFLLTCTPLVSFASASEGCQVATTGSVGTKNCADTLPMQRSLFSYLISIVSMLVDIMTVFLLVYRRVLNLFS